MEEEILPSSFSDFTEELRIDFCNVGIGWTKEEVIEVVAAEKPEALILMYPFDNIVELVSFLFALREKKSIDTPIKLVTKYSPVELETGAFGKFKGVGNQTFATLFKQVKSYKDIEILRKED